MLAGGVVLSVLEASEISISNSRTILRQSVKLLKGVGVADTGALPCDGQSSAESCASKQCIAAIRDLKQHVDLQIKMRRVELESFCTLKTGRVFLFLKFDLFEGIFPSGVKFLMTFCLLSSVKLADC